MNLALKLFVLKNKIIGTVLPSKAAESAKELFLTPRKYPIKDWEHEKENLGKRLTLGNGLSAITWGNSDRKILLVHGWESRATQMAGYVESLVNAGFQVFALDSPAHGHSEGQQANPLMFAKAVVQANADIGPFDAIIGHSMGGSAVAIALSEGVDAKKVVLVSSPSSIENVLTQFASFIGLPKKSAQAFLNLVEQVVGRPAKELDIAELIKKTNSQGLIVHDQDDIEVPFENAQSIQKNWKGSRLLSTQGYGHRSILRQKGVWDSIVEFIEDDV